MAQHPCKHKHFSKTTYPHHSMQYSFCALGNESIVIVKSPIIKVKGKSVASCGLQATRLEKLY